MASITKHAISDPLAALKFLVGGRSRVTLRSARTGNRVTYRINVADKEKRDCFFISALTGSDNTASYSYMGILRKVGNEFVLQRTAKSKFGFDSMQWKAFEYAYRHLLKSNIPSGLEIWHEGRCGCCGRVLTVPESIETGIGPVCANKQ